MKKKVQGEREDDPEGKRVERKLTLMDYVPTAIAVLIVLIAIAVGFQQKRYHNDQVKIASEQQATQQHNDFTIRKSQYDGCVNGANVLRQQVRAEFISLKEDVLIPVFSEVANTVPPQALVFTILNDAIDNMEVRIKTIGQRIPNIHCFQKYPPLPGQPDFRIEKDNG